MFEIRLDWHGEEVKRNIRHKINNGTVKATRFLLSKIKAKINEWGSDYITSTKRKRVRHSAAGQPPLKQTGNLEKSFDLKYEMGTDGYIVGSVISDVPYAATLEKGGSSQIDQSQKTHTSVRLVNPLKKVIGIAARPFARPTLHENKDKLIKIIMKG
jgi:phage gpG-like protein